MKRTIKEVAKEAGVSIATVSRVLNGKDRVRSSTRQKVEAAIEKLNFQPDEVARTMILKETKSIGLIVPFISNEYWALLSEVIQEQLWSMGYTLMLLTRGTRLDKEIACLETLVKRKVDGIIYSASPSQSSESYRQIEQLLMSGIPTVTMEQKLSGFSGVSGDHLQGAKNAVQHLIRLGHQKIAYIGGPFVSPLRELGYRQALFVNGIEVDEKIIVRGEPTFQFGYQAIKHLLLTKEKFSAIFCGNDLIAFGVMKVLEELNIRVPDDIAMVGYDDIHMASLYKPGLTTVRQPIREMGIALVDLLLEAIQNRAAQLAPKHRLFPMELSIRESCGASRVSQVGQLSGED